MIDQPEYAIGEIVKACGLRGVVTAIRVSARTKSGFRYAYTVQIGGTGGREYPAGQLMAVPAEPADMAKIVIDEIDRVVGRIEVTPEQAERRKTEEAKIAARRSFRRIGRNR